MFSALNDGLKKRKSVVMGERVFPILPMIRAREFGSMDDEQKGTQPFSYSIASVS